MGLQPPTYDFIIFGFLTIDLFVAIVFLIQFLRLPDKTITTWSLLIFLFLLVCGGVVIYGSFVEPRLITVPTQEIDIGIGQDTPVKIALISDIHVGPYKDAKFVRKVVDKTNGLSPDIVILAGDFVYGEEIDVSQLDPLKDLSAPMGVFAVLGNHDYDDWLDPRRGDGYTIWNDRARSVVEKLNALGVRVFINKSVPIANEAGKILFTLGGVNDLWTGKADIAETFRQAFFDAPRILISHNPDIMGAAVLGGVDLILSGHTHGGQIRLPFWGSVPQLPTRLGQKYDAGFFDFGASKSLTGRSSLFITSGIGETGPRARLFEPPEIVLLLLK